MANDRNRNGTFALGNPGGPGRPRRALERQYLAALAEAISPADWRAIVTRAVADTKSGNPKARDWLSKHLLDDPWAGGWPTRRRRKRPWGWWSATTGCS